MKKIIMIGSNIAATSANEVVYFTSITPSKLQIDPPPASNDTTAHALDASRMRCLLRDAASSSFFTSTLGSSACHAAMTAAKGEAPCGIAR